MRAIADVRSAPPLVYALKITFAAICMGFGGDISRAGLTGGSASATDNISVIRRRACFRNEGKLLLLRCANLTRFAGSVCVAHLDPLQIFGRLKSIVKTACGISISKYV